MIYKIHPTGSYNLTEGFDTVDMQVVEAFFTSSEAYWTAEDPAEERLKAWKNSNCYSLKTHAGHMIGGFRLITDRAFFGYVADVFILPEYRGQGLAKWMVETTLSTGDYKRVKRWSLQTKDAHALYAKIGFTPVLTPEWQMEKRCQ